MSRAGLLCTPRVRLILYFSVFSVVMLIIKMKKKQTKKTTSHACMPYFCQQNSVSMPVLMAKRKNKKIFSCCSPFFVERHLTTNSYTVLWEASLPVLQLCFHVCMCNASEVGWPHTFLKSFIKSLITQLARRLYWGQQGLLANPHPIPWVEKDHRDQRLTSAFFPRFICTSEVAASLQCAWCDLGEITAIFHL